MTANQPQSRHPAALSPEERTTLETCIDALNEKLVPHLATPTPEQRRSLKPLDGEQVAFMNAMYKHMKANPQLVPDTVDMRKFESDLNNFNFLDDVQRRLEKIVDVLRERRLQVDPVSRFEAADAVWAAMSRGEPGRAGTGDRAAGADGGKS